MFLKSKNVSKIETVGKRLKRSANKSFTADQNSAQSDGDSRVWRIERLAMPKKLEERAVDNSR